MDLGTLAVWSFLAFVGIFISFMGFMILVASVARAGNLVARSISSLSSRRST